MLRTLFLLLGITLLFSQTTMSQTNMSNYEPHTNLQIKGETYLKLETAISEFRSKFQKPQIDKYDIMVIANNGQVIVIFQNKNRPTGYRGNPGPLPEFEVVMTSTNKVLRSNFVR